MATFPFFCEERLPLPEKKGRSQVTKDLADDTKTLDEMEANTNMYAGDIQTWKGKVEEYSGLARSLGERGRGRKGRQSVKLLVRSPFSHALMLFFVIKSLFKSACRDPQCSHNFYESPVTGR